MGLKTITLIVLLFTAVGTLADGVQKELPKTDEISLSKGEVDTKLGPQPTPPIPSTTVPTTTTSTTTTTTTTTTTSTMKPTPPPTPSSTTTTTSKPTTTSTTTTTQPPPTTTTTSTPAPITTTPAPLPKTDWYVLDNGTICILAFMKFKINVKYPAQNKTEGSTEFQFSKIENATATGTCSLGDDRQKLELTFTNLITATFIFAENKTAKEPVYFLKSVELNIPTTLLPNTTLNVTAVPYTHDGDVFTVAMNRSFTCASVDPLHLNGSFPNTNGTLTILDAHVEAFGTKKKAEYSAGIDCKSFQTPDIVPIVVGLILAGLVVVVLIAYLIGRRRAQARGYLSM